jgi:hypothetical protein
MSEGGKSSLKYPGAKVFPRFSGHWVKQLALISQRQLDCADNYPEGTYVTV